MNRHEALAELFDKLVDMAGVRVHQLDEDDLPPKREVAVATVMGITIQRAVDVAKYLGDDDDLPRDIAELPDDEQRELVKRLLWRHARSGKGNSARDLAGKLGMKDARTSGLEVVLGGDIEELIKGRVAEVDDGEAAS